MCVSSQTYMERLDVLLYHSLFYFLIEPVARLVVSKPQASSCLHLYSIRDTGRHTATPFYVHARDSNSDPHIWATSAFTYGDISQVLLILFF